MLSSPKFMDTSAFFLTHKGPWPEGGATKQCWKVDPACMVGGRKKRAASLFSKSEHASVVGLRLLQKIESVMEPHDVMPLPPPDPNQASSSSSNIMGQRVTSTVFTSPPVMHIIKDGKVDGPTHLCMDWSQELVARAEKGDFHPMHDGYIRVLVGWQFQYGKRMPVYEYAHRLVMMALHGTVLGDGDVVCHTCDRKTCLSPLHMVLGTQSINASGGKNKKDGEGLCLAMMRLREAQRVVVPATNQQQQPKVVETVVEKVAGGPRGRGRPSKKPKVA